MRQIAAALLLVTAGCSPPQCDDIECVMSHLTLTRDGRALPLVALPADLMPMPSLPAGTMAMGSFELLITPLSSSNWGDPVAMMQAGLRSHAGAGSPDAAMAPSISNQPADLKLPSATSDAPLELDYLDPNGCFPSICFTPYDPAGGRPYPHCVWCTHAERDNVVAGKANLRAGINALVGNLINFDLPVGRACSNPRTPDGGPANPGLPNCPTGQRRCGNGCIPMNGTVCCDTGVQTTSAYCTNPSGGAREGACFPSGGCGSAFCCAMNGSFSSNDCPANQHHCGLNCYSLDHPCCPFGSTDPACNRGAIGGAPVGIGVTPPAAPAGGGGGGGDCNYDGVWTGRFYWTCNDNPMRTDVSGSVGVTLTLKNLVSGVNNQAILYVTSVVTDDNAFGFTSNATVATNLATLPCSNPAPSGSGIIIGFPKGAFLGTTNQANALTVTNGGRTLQNSDDPAYAGMTWTGSTGLGDSNSRGSGPGGHVYNSCKFTHWVLNRQ